MRKVLFSIGAGIASVALLAGCSSLYLEKGSIEAELTKQVEEQVGVTPDITCPDDLPGEVDAEIECEMTLPDDDAVHDIKVTAKAVDKDTQEIEYEWEALN